MKKLFQALILLFSFSLISQNDSIKKEKYKVIDAIYKNVDTTKYGKPKLEKDFFIFLGLKSIIANPNFIDNLYGHCADYENEIIYSYSDILNRNEISELGSQIDYIGKYKEIDSQLISEKVELVDNKDQFHFKISYPLVYKDKAIVYRTNSNNEEVLFVFEKKDGEWMIRCRKWLYLRFDD